MNGVTKEAGGEAEAAINLVRDVLAFLLSWVVLAAIAIIVSGKLVAKRFPLGFDDDADFRIPLIIFHLRARGDEVSLGLILFILTLAFSIVAGGPAAYEFFKRQSGIDVGQWNSLCVIASFTSVMIALLIYMVAPLFRGQPIVDEAEREETLRRSKDHGDGSQ